MSYDVGDYGVETYEDKDAPILRTDEEKHTEEPKKVSQKFHPFNFVKEEAKVEEPIIKNSEVDVCIRVIGKV